MRKRSRTLSIAPTAVLRNLLKKKSKSRKLIIAIDGPAGSGKSTTARALAARLKLPYIDTGAMYRTVTLKIMQKGIPFTDKKRMVAIAKTIKIKFVGAPFMAPKKGAINRARTGQRVFMDGKDVTKEIREPELTKNVMFVARETPIRHEMVKKQRVLGRREGAVMEGRDIGSVVFPNADYKFYFDADVPTRALRRWRELKASGKEVSLGRVKKEIKVRDLSDFKRKTGALKVARGAQVLDTSGLTIEATVDKILASLGRRP